MYFGAGLGVWERVRVEGLFRSVSGLLTQELG